jgi:predicted tellurium resistance membrane protein TerC
VMVAAVVLSTVAMLAFARQVGDFVEKHPTVKMLGLAFLILIGFNLVAEGTHVHIPKGYTYFAMAFAIGVEMLNLRVRAKSAPVRLHEPHQEP